MDFGGEGEITQEGQWAWSWQVSMTGVHGLPSRGS